MAVKKYFEGEPRHNWPADVARYNEHLIDDKRFHNEAELQAYMQYRFDLAWCELMNYAHKKGIEVIGASSDHTILDVEAVKDKVHVGDVLEFGIKAYGPMAYLTSSDGVHMVFKGGKQNA